MNRRQFFGIFRTAVVGGAALGVGAALGLPPLPAKALDHGFATGDWVVTAPELMAALEETGMGNHPEFVRFFYRVGKASESLAKIERSFAEDIADHLTGGLFK